MIVGPGRIRFALGDGATDEQAARIWRLLRDAGYLDRYEGPIPPLVGVAEIAKLAGVTTGAVCQWPDMPPPLVVLKAGPVWELHRVRPRINACVARRERREAK